jgi:hypothetical protein
VSSVLSGFGWRLTVLGGDFVRLEAPRMFIGRLHAGAGLSFAIRTRL